MTADTVAVETPAAFATSLMVAISLQRIDLAIIDVLPMLVSAQSLSLFSA